MNDHDKIIEIAKQHHNLFRTKMIVDAGIRKERLRELLELGTIKKLGHGYYALAETNSVDSYYLFQQHCKKGIYSYATAAYLWQLIDSRPLHMDCTVPRGYNTSYIRSEKDVRYHYVVEDFYSVGQTTFQLSENESIMIYDKERTICDYIRHRNRIVPKEYSMVLNRYFKSRDMDVRKLAKYGRIFRISKELEMYMNVL